MNESYPHPTDSFQLRIFAIKHPFVKEMTYDFERESYTFTLKENLGDALPYGGEIEFWASADQTFIQELHHAYRNQVVNFYKRKGDIENTNKALALLRQCTTE